jgi:hypothetical protein
MMDNDDVEPLPLQRDFMHLPRKEQHRILKEQARQFITHYEEIATEREA